MSQSPPISPFATDETQKIARMSEVGVHQNSLRRKPVDRWPMKQWTCPRTNLVVPKKLEDNLRWRMSLRKSCDENPEVRASVLAACKKSLLFWMNSFCWTYRIRYVNEKGETVPTSGHQAHYPMITWPVQDEAILRMDEAIENSEDINAEKSRDMGASWLVLFLFDWRFLFRREQQFGVVSRKEVLVDAKGDMDSLFEKLRYVHANLPSWMVPKISGRYMHLKNHELGSAISGESTNADVGRGGRKLAYVVDEAAAVPNGEEVEGALSQTTGCQIWVSTPKGPGTQFYKRIKAGRGVRISMPWWRHPEKAQGAKQYQDELGHIKWTSPWYGRLAEKMSSKAIAQEVDMDHGRAGDMFFDFTEIERHRMDHARKPLLTGDIVAAKKMDENEHIAAIRSLSHESFRFWSWASRCQWKLWFKLIENRPPQNCEYVLGADISNGAGNSNSVITVLDNLSGRVMAKYWDAHTSPERLAVIAATAGVWFGGVHTPAFLIWENNGPGGIFGRKLISMGYPRYYLQRQITSKGSERTNRYGWNSSREKKELLLGSYRDQLASDRIIQPCAESLDEAGDYIYDEYGRLLPARLREETEGGRELHGDHVIADALCALAREDLPSQRKREIRAPSGSFAHRRRLRQQSAKKQHEWAR